MVDDLRNAVILARLGREFRLEEFLHVYVVIKLLGLCVYIGALLKRTSLK